MVPVTGEFKNRLPKTSKKVNTANKNNTMQANIADKSTIFFIIFCIKLGCFESRELAACLQVFPVNAH